MMAGNYGLNGNKEIIMKKPLTWYWYGCNHRDPKTGLFCNFFKSSTHMMGKCPKCGHKLTRYGTFPK